MLALQMLTGLNHCSMFNTIIKICQSQRVPKSKSQYVIFSLSMIQMTHFYSQMSRLIPISNSHFMGIPVNVHTNTRVVNPDTCTSKVICDELISKLLRISVHLCLLSITHECFICDRLVCLCLYVCPSICLSVRFHDNSRTISRRMMKLGTYIFQVKSNTKLEDVS